MDILLFGIQGSGKGTQARKLAAERGYRIFEAGAELRRIAASDTDLGRSVKATIDAGHHVSQEIIMEVVERFLSALPPDAAVLFDGIPRNLGQQEAFDALMARLSRTFRCLELRVDEEAAIKRILGRAALEGRNDDANEESIRRRIGLFHEKTQPVIDIYRARDMVVDIDGDGTVGDVYGRLQQALDA
ncbi:MAG: adenylate kinase [Candidatus Peregrinibacteria bacterium Gr01-1014_25]|nr:MAG: adenylate kinase [Candidatus Peregrinibacteria bacterium Gr01-1014_25]